MFTPQQVKQFKEAFNMIDQDGDGRVTESDLRLMLSNLGMSRLRNPSTLQRSIQPPDKPLEPSILRPPYALVGIADRNAPGQTPTPSLLNALLSSRPGGAASTDKTGINFTQFLSMMGEHLLELDPEPELLEAFACFDEGDKGVVQVGEMRRWLGELGDRMDDKEVCGAETGLGKGIRLMMDDGGQIDRLFGGSFTDRQGRFNYVEFAKVLRVNDGEEEREDKLAV